MVRQIMEKNVGSATSAFGGKRKREGGFSFGKDMKKIKKECIESRGGGMGKNRNGKAKGKGRIGETESIDLTNDSDEENEENEDDGLMVPEGEEY
jgi:hypothetical protein